MLRSALFGMLAVFLLFSSTAGAAEGSGLPAVSEVNGKIDFRGGLTHGQGAALAGGSLSIPVMHSFGVQLDGAGGGIGSQGVYAGAVHGFLRDPSWGLIGGTFERVQNSPRFYNRFGGEGEYYFPKFTVEGRVGYQNGMVGHGAYTGLNLSWYLSDNIAITPGFRSSDDRVWGRLNGEWQPGFFKDAPGFTLFGAAGAGNHGIGFALTGVRYYFGTPKSLQRRHREDDPLNLAAEDLGDDAAGIGPGVSHSTGGGGGGGGCCT